MRLHLPLILFALFLLSCTSKPAGPVVITSGFVVDSTLNDVIFPRQGRQGNLDGYSNVERYTEKEGVRSYTMHRLPRPFGMSEAEYRKIAVPRDTMRVTLWQEYYDCDGEFKEAVRVVLTRDPEVDIGCEVTLKFDTIPARSARERDTVTIKGEVLICAYSDVSTENNAFIPDSAYLSFNRMPEWECDGLVGYVYAYGSEKKYSFYWGDIYFDGAFKIDLQPE